MLFGAVFFAKVACVSAPFVPVVAQLVHVLLAQPTTVPVHAVGFPSVKRTRIFLVLFPVASTLRHELIAAAVFVQPPE
jgi:hypothetical protein